MANGADERVVTLRQNFETNKAQFETAKRSFRELIASQQGMEKQQQRMDAAYAQALLTELRSIEVTKQNKGVIDSASRSLANFIDHVSDASQTERRATDDTTGFVRALTEQTDAQERANRASAESIQTLQQQNQMTQRATDTAERFARAQNEASARRGAAGNFGNVLQQADRSGRVGGQVLSGLGFGEAANTVGLFGDLADAAGSLNPVLLVTTALGVGFAAVLGDVKRRMEEAKEAGERFAQGGQQIAELAAGGATSADARESIANLEAAAQAARTYNSTLVGFQFAIGNIDNLTNSLLESLGEASSIGDFERVAQIQGQIADLDARQVDVLRQVSEFAGEDLNSFDALNVALASNSVFLDNIKTRQEDYNRAIDVGVFAANDATAAQERLETIMRDGIGAVLDFREGFQDFLQQTADKTEETREAVLNFVHGGLALIPDAVGAGVDALKQLAEQQRELRSQVATSQFTQYLKALQQEGEARQKITTAQEALNAFREESAAKETAIETEAREKRFAALQDAEDERQKLEQEAAADELKALKEHGRRRDEINRSANMTIEEAQLNRDVAGARKAERNRQEELRKNDIALEDRLDTLDDNLKKQQQAIDDRHRKQLQTIEDTANKALTLERRRAQNELATRQRAVQEAETQLRNALSAQQLIQRNHLTQTQTMTSSAFVNIANIMSSGLATAQTAVSNFISGVMQRLQQGPQQNLIGAGYVPPRTGSPFLNIPFQFLPQPNVAPASVYQQSPAARAPYSPTINAPSGGTIEQRVLSDLRRVMGGRRVTR